MARSAAALADALQAPDIPSQVEGVHAILAKLDVAKAAGEAAAALAQTRGGSPAARAYLTTVATSFTTGPSPSADAVVAYCASMERGRKPVRGAFLAVWKRATDLRAVDAAYKNLSRVMIDDPDLLDVALEVAGRLGDRKALADYGARLDRATRLRPLVVELAGPSRANASRKLARLSAEDRRHVYARVVDAPRSFAQSLAVTAVLALADDLGVADACLANAIAVMNPAPLVKAWQTRVRSGDDAVVARLLGLFEWTALWAKDPAELELFSRALASCAGRRDVFAQIENALASEREVVREAICLHWLGHHNYSAGQHDTLMRMAVAIADGRDDTRDRRAALAALGKTRFDAAFPAIADGIRSTRSSTLRGILYAAVADNRHPGVDAFLIEQLFVERDGVAGLVDAIAARRDPAFHDDAIVAVVPRQSIRAATLYADALIASKLRAQLVALGRALRAWQPTTTDDERRLRYVIEHAAAAALASKHGEVARELWARAKELPSSGYSDYHVVGHDRVTPMPTAKLAALDKPPSRARR